jgi:glycosyltransferase involved in cell wall biosynthesis
VDVTVCVSTFGKARIWAERAERAAASATAQGVPVITANADTLADARNAALREVRSEWVVFLDADDELAPGYFEAMEAGNADLRAPAVQYVKPNGRSYAPYVPKVAGHTHDCTAECLPEGNWLVVGSALRTGLALDVGGWHEYEVYEDWDLFLRCWIAGASFEPLPDAVYIAHMRPDSRNRNPDMEFKNRVHREIVAANFP